MSAAELAVPPGLPEVGAGEPSSRRFARRRCLVTGAAGGIGRATVLRLAAEGGRVLALDMDGDGAWETAALAGGAAEGVQVDIRDPAGIEHLPAIVAETLGRLDVLVNNAGVEILGSVPETSVEAWDEVMGVNLRGAFLVSRALLPLLREAAAARGQAAIVNNASLMGLVSSPRLAAYCASKAGLVSLTRSMALDHAADGIRVNCVCPGIVHTAMLERRFALEDDRAAAYRRTAARPPVNYLGRPEDVAAAIAYLAADESRFVTGTALTIDGGVGAA